MLFWLACAVLTAGVVTALTRPLFAARTAPDASPRAPDVAIYRDQLAEIERDRARGLLAPTEAEAARIEVSRRLLARADAEAPAAPSPAPGPATHRLGVIVMGAVPLLALAGYLIIGAPGIPGQPHRERLAAPADRISVEELVQRVEERLRAAPEDGRGWDAIAPVYFRQERFADAAQAFARAARLLGETEPRLAGLGEATVFANNGVVTEEARRAFEKIVALEPRHPQARFWLALAFEQDGNLARAKADYARLIADAPADAPWRAAVAERLKGVEARLATAPAGKAAGPTAEDVAAAAALSDEDRSRMIGAMVEGLAERLRRDGSDLGGWQRLVRAYTVLGQRDKAMEALARARTVFQANAVALAELDQLAQTLGLGS
jgi:cytochrome c-type biogenesis protein CcmH